MKKNKQFNLKFLIKVGVVALCLGGCIATKCFIDTNKTITPVTSKVVKKETRGEIKIDYSEFKDIWNKKIYRLQLDNRHLSINFSKYKIEDNNTQNNRKQLDKYINFDKKLTNIKTNLQNSKYVSKYTPLIEWIELKSKINPDNNKTVLSNSKELMTYLSDSINPKGYFSNNTIDEIIKMNEFCYYFEKNKKSFYNKGYSRNIKKCKQIQNILDRDKIEFVLNN